MDINTITTFSLIVFSTIFAWLVLGYMGWKAWKRRQQPKSNPIIGHIASLKMTPEGLIATGVLNEEGVRRAAHGDFNGFGTLAMKNVKSEDQDGVRVIKHAEPLYLSLDTQPNAFGETIDFVGTQPHRKKQ